jgi:hypothetical protein
MAKNLAVNDRIFVPASMLNLDDVPSAFIETEVVEVIGRKVRINFRETDHRIASSKCQRNIGLLIICIGDLETEPTLLDPLSKTTYASTRSVLWLSWRRSGRAGMPPIRTSCLLLMVTAAA